MKRKEILPLSAAELAEAERWIRIVLDPTQHKPDKVSRALAETFLRLLALHRATERQSVMLQGQVTQLQSEVEHLEAELRIRGELA